MTTRAPLAGELATVKYALSPVSDPLFRSRIPFATKGDRCWEDEAGVSGT